MATLMTESASYPFIAALGADLDDAAPAVRAHLSQTAGTRQYRGTLRAFWRRGGWPGRIVAAALNMGTWADVLRPEQGAGLRFDLENRIIERPDKPPIMVWQRTFHFRRGPRQFAGRIAFVPNWGSVVDALGPLQVELIPRVVDGAVTMDSGRQWFDLRFFRLPVPHWPFGSASIREWAEPDGRIGLSLSIHNPFLGNYLGYEAILEPVAEDARQL